MPILAAGALIFDENQQILAVKPTYKEMWEIPGGIVEPFESPKTACERELLEELGLSVKTGNLLSVIHTPKLTSDHDKLQFIFDGGCLNEKLIKQITLPADELSEWRFIPRGNIDKYFPHSLSQRVKHALRNQKIEYDSYSDFVAI